MPPLWMMIIGTFILAVIVLSLTEFGRELLYETLPELICGLIDSIGDSIGDCDFGGDE